MKRFLLFATTLILLGGTIQGVEAQSLDWQASLDAGIKAYNTQNYANAIENLRLAVSKCEASAPDSLDLARCLIWLGSACQNAGRYAEAQPLYKRSLDIYEKKLGADHPKVAVSLNNLAELCRSQGRYAEAEPLYKRSLDIRERKLGADHPDVATAINNLALLYRFQGRYAEAESLYKRSLDIYEKRLGADHPDVAQSLNNLAGLYSNQGRYVEAEPLYKRSLDIREKKLGADHPDVAQSLNNLALLYGSQGRYAEAEPLYKRSLEIWEKKLGADHPDVAVSLNNLAGLYSTQGRYAEAEPLYKRSLEIFEKKLGADHPDVAQSLSNLALLYRFQGRYAEAEPLYKRSLEIKERKIGADHPDVALSLNNLAALYQSQGRYAEAEPLFKRSLDIRDRKLGADHPDVAQSLNNLAELCRSQGRYAEAEPLYKRSLDIYEKKLGADHPDIALSLNNLAGLYFTQGRYAEAESLYKSALALNEKRFGVKREIGPFAKTAERKRFNMVLPLENIASRKISREGYAKGWDRQNSAPGFDAEIACLKLLEVDPRAAVMPHLGDIFANRKKTFGIDDPRTAEVLIQLGILRRALGGISKKQSNEAYESLSKFGRALCDTANGASTSRGGSEVSAVVESMGGDAVATSFAANALLCLGNLLATDGEIEKAKDSFNLCEKCFLIEPRAAESNLVQNLLILCESWMYLGEYARAQELATKATNCATSKIAKYDCAVFDARLKLEQADYSGAFDNAKSCLALGTEAVSNLNSDTEKSQALLNSYNILIEAALSMGKLRDAKEFADQALQLKGLSKQGQAYLLVLKGTVDFRDGSFEEAKKVLQAAEALNDGGMDLDQTTFTQGAAMTGFVLERLGDFTVAQRSLGWAFNWDKKNLSSEGLLAAARDCNGLALIEIDRVAANDKDGDADRAKYYALEGSQRVDKYIKTAFPGLSIGQQCAFLSVAKEQRDAILTTCQKKESIGPAYSMMMRWKGLLLESLRTRGAIKAAVQDNPDLKQKQEQLESKIRLLASLANKGGDTATGDTKEEYRRETAERERLEREISLAAGVVLKDPLSDIGVDLFRGLLKADEAFIDILPYKPLNEQAEHYAIVAMKSGSDGEPQFFNLGKRNEIDEIVRRWRFAVTGSQSELKRDVQVDNGGNTSKVDLKQLDDSTAKLSDLLLTNAKLREYLGTNVRRLWLCPEDEFGRVPWTAIALLRGIKNLSISEVDSPREFAFLRMDKSGISSDKQKKVSKILLAGLSDFQRAGLNNLDGALKEVETLKKLADKLDRDVVYLPEYDATKESVKSKLTAVANAHIATHGFAGSSSAEAEGERGSRGVRFTMRQDGIVKLATARNPLSECGIYLAYPKDNSSSTTGGDQTPNVLTADEIIGLDLSKCEILTLSACETGLGRTLSGQGVIGLRSAIIGAGAKAVLMSLWSVPDEATQELMKRFYSNLWKEGMKKQDALADAQSYIRQQPKWKDPKNWAAWVLVGE